MSTSSIMRELFRDDFDHDIDNNPPENIEEFDHANVVVEDSDQEDDSNPPKNNYGEGFDNNVVEDDLDGDKVPPMKMLRRKQQLFESYQEHARLKGFSVVKRTENERYARMVCDRSGTSKAQKCSKKVDYKARLNEKKQDDGTCMVTTMVSEHTHEIDPTFSQLMPAHRQLQVNLKRQLEANDIAVQCSGHQNLVYLTKDCRNYIEERRGLRLGEGDAEAIR
ncbi:hypothetical protein ACS0TY_029652 [Phlomoides rotata]